MAKKKRRPANYYYCDSIRVANKKRKLCRHIKRLTKKLARLETKGVVNKIQPEIDRSKGILESL